MLFLFYLKAVLHILKLLLSFELLHLRKYVVAVPYRGYPHLFKLFYNLAQSTGPFEVQYSLS